MKLAAPATASMLSYTIVGLVDTLMVGPLGPAALGGVGLSNALLFTVGALFIGLVGAVSPLTAQHEGAGQKRHAGTFIHQAIWLAIAGGLGLGLSLNLGADLWIGLLSPGEQVAIFASDYLAWRAVGLIPLFALVAYDHLLQGLGDTRTPMKLAIISNIINLVMTAWLVRGGLGVEPMGVSGAAIGTVISYTFTALQYQWVLRRLHKEDADYALWPLQLPQAEPMAQLVKVGLPMGVQFVVDVASWLAMSTFIGWISDEALAASQIVGRLVSVPLMMAHGVTVAATSLVGRYIGAKEWVRARVYGWTAVVTGMGLTFILALGAAIWPEQLVALFTDDHRVQVVGASLLLVSVGLMVAETFACGAYGMLQGAGDTRFTMKVTLGATWGIGVPLSWALAFPLGWGANGVFIAMGLQMLTISACYVARIRGQTWLKQGLTQHEPDGEAVEGAVALGGT